MASLPFVAASASAGGTLKLKPESAKHPSSSTSLATQKSPSILHQKNISLSQLDVSSESRNLDFRECIDHYSYAPLLQECVDNNSVRGAQIAHAHIVKTGTHKDLFTMTSLISVYSKCGSMENAYRVFDKLPQRNTISWTAMMVGYVRNSQPECAIQAFQEMLDSGFYPTNYTIGIVLNACSSLQSVKLAMQIHAYIIKYKIDFENSIGNALCTIYSKNGMLEAAVKAFEGIREKNVVSWTAVISACGDNGQSSMGLKFFSKMISEEVEPNKFTLTCVLRMCITVLSLSLGVQVHSLCIKLGYEAELLIRNSIMYLYLRCGWINEAWKLFDRTQASLVTWNALISGHAQMTDHMNDDLLERLSGTEALNIFMEMNHSGMKPDMFTFSSILTICNNLVALEQGEQIHAQTIKTGFLSDVVVGTALVNMYNKCGSIERATTAFVEMSTRTMISWTNMISGFAQHGQSQQALELFKDMRLAGVRPNQITFVGVLSACAHAGMVNEALDYFNMMQKEYKIRPVMDHFICLVDMYVRLARLDEAFGLVSKMNYQPSELIWSMLIAGCRIHGNSELGYYAAEQLLQLKPKDAGTYVMLLNMYQSAGRWSDVSRTRELMREEKIGKLNDWSWISIRDEVHWFKPDDQLHPYNADMNKLLEDLLVKAQSLGYEPLQSIEVSANDEDEDEDKTLSSTVYQSEKLAVAFGMLNTQDGMPIRVLKSTSMCRDSHSFLSFVSLLTSRKIIIRDSKRLHKFVNGQCLCGGFGALL